MIVNENVRDYINSLRRDLPNRLTLLEEWAIEHEVPIIRKEAQEFLRFLLEKDKPIEILEIGTAIGFSTLYMLEFAPEKAHITTIEKVEMRLKEARKNLSGNQRVTLLEGDAAIVLDGLLQNNRGSSFDLIFLDAAKGQYPAFLPAIMKLLKPNGVLVTDNVLLEGSIADSKFSIERRDRTIHMRMRDFLYTLTHDNSLSTVILPVGDGMAVSYKKV